MALNFKLHPSPFFYFSRESRSPANHLHKRHSRRRHMTSSRHKKEVPLSSLRSEPRSVFACFSGEVAPSSSSSALQSPSHVHATAVRAV